MASNRLEIQDVGINWSCHHHLFQHGKPMIERDFQWHQVQQSPPTTTRTEWAPVHGEVTSAMEIAKTTPGWESGVEWRAVFLSADCEANLRQVGNA